MEAGLAAAATGIEATYETPPQYHNADGAARHRGGVGRRHAVDRHAQPGHGDGAGAHRRLFGIPPEDIHIRSPFLGGGFGSKGLLTGPQVLGIMAARLVGRPVKLVLRREQMYGPVGHRAPTRQTMRMGTDADGGFTAIATTRAPRPARSTISSSPRRTWRTRCTPPRRSPRATRRCGSTPGRRCSCARPARRPAAIALESAIDEMAEACGMDPLAFRLKNYAEVEPVSGKPFSSKALRECYAQGAERFGWAGRPLRRGRCATRTGCWSAGAWARRRSRR